ncbi:MAG: hypothetical protein LBJ45_00110 [Holosporaceae bacterium]|jgi:hypothetical protein|nr:hypothetical protein [Holosporaceae bacterium]
MKKRLLMGGVFAFAVFYSELEGRNQTSYEHKNKEIEEVVDQGQKGGIRSGFYAAAGFLRSVSISKVQQTEDVVRVDAAGSVLNLSTTDDAETFGSVALLDKYTGGVPRVWHSYAFDRVNYPVAQRDTIISGLSGSWFGCKDVSHGRSSKVGGALAFGYSGLIGENSLWGVEATFDIAGSKSSEDDYWVYGKVQRKNRGFVPTLAARFGLYSSYADALFYLRLGVANLKSEVVNNSRSLKLNKLTPIIGVGVEKDIDGDLSARLEFDYRIQSEKSGDILIKKVEKKEIVDFTTEGTDASLDFVGKGRIRTKGYAVRVMAVWHI